MRTYKKLDLDWLGKELLAELKESFDIEHGVQMLYKALQPEDFCGDEVAPSDRPVEVFLPRRHAEAIKGVLTRVLWALDPSERPHLPFITSTLEQK